MMFIALKLLGKINWSWWWVLSPIWLVGLIIVVIVVIVFIVLIIKQA